MHHIPLLITDLALILTVAAAATIICRKLKQPLVLGYVVAGFLIGPAVGWFPNVGDSEGISTWSEIGVIFLMFGLGLEFSIVRLLNVGRSAVITAVTEMALMPAAGMLCGTALGWSFFSSLFLGGMLAISSTTIIIKAFDDLGLKGKKFTELVFGSLVVEDIMGIFMMVVLSTMAVSASLDGGAVVVELGQMALYLVAWFALSVIFVPSLLSRVVHIVSDEILLVASLALCLCMVALANAIGFSSALGAFLAGSILAGTAQAHRIESLFKSVKDLFGAVFFVSVGMLLSPDAVVQNAPAIIAITLVTLLGKPVFTFLGAMLSGQSLKTSVKCGMSLSQIGEFSFIIAALGASLGVTSDFLYPIIVAVSVITTLTTPVYVKNSDRLYRALAKVLPGRILERIDSAKDETDGTEGASNLWANHAKRWTLKVVLVVLSATASVEVLKKIIEPLLATAIPNEALSWTVMVTCVVITGLFMSNVFHADRTTEFNVLWMKDKRNHIPLTLLTIIGAVICVGMVFFIVNASGVGQSPIPYLIALVVTGAMAVSKRIHSLFIRLETSFIGNLNESIIAKRRDALSDEERETWVKRNLYVVEVETTRMLQHRAHLRTAPRAVRPVFQMDRDRADLPAAQVDFGEHRAAAADALLPVEIPVVLLRQAQHLRPDDRPAGKHRVAMHAAAGVGQLDKLQPEHIVHAERARQLRRDVAAARPDAAVIQLVGEQQVKRLHVRARLQKLDLRVQMHAPLHVEDQRVQRIPRAGRRAAERAADLRLRKLADVLHHAVLRLLLQPRGQLLQPAFCDMLHPAPPVTTAATGGGARSADRAPRRPDCPPRPASACKAASHTASCRAPPRRAGSLRRRASA